MSTRCQIKLKNSEDNIHIYKNSDGYPSDVLATLIPFVKRFKKQRGYDECYLLCQIVRAFAARDYKRRNLGYSKCGDDENFASGQDYLEWGLDCVEHGDIAYLYEIDEDCNVWVNGEMVTDENYEAMIAD